MQFNINLETEIENLAKEIESLHKQEKNLETLDKIQKLKERHGELVAERDEQLNNVLETAKAIMTDNNKLADKVQVHLNALSNAYHEIESGKYSVSFTMQLEKEADEHLQAICDLHGKDIEEKQKALNKLYNRYRMSLTTRAKDVTSTEAMLIKEELSVLTDVELQEFHANNRNHEVIRRLAAVEMKKRNVQELQDISPLANMVNRWAKGLNAELTRHDSKHGITYFKAEEIGVKPANLTRSNIKSLIRKANKGVDKPVYTTLGDLLK